MRKNRIYWLGIVSLIIYSLPVGIFAQSYEQMWKQVEILQQKQLPESAIIEVRKIYDLASRERNVPQLMKAYLTKASLRIDVTPDSLANELAGLKAWARKETDPVHRAVLNNLLGYYILDTGNRDEEAINEAISYFRLSLQDKELLAEKTAEDYRPLTVSKTLTEKYCNDNMYQLLARQAIIRLQGYWIQDPVLTEKMQLEILSIYDGLINFYKQHGMRDAQLLSMLDKLRVEGYDAGRGGVNEKLRLSKEAVVALLKQWSVEFADSPLCGEVYNQLAVRYDDMNDYRAKLETAQAGLEKYPQSPSTHDLKEQVAEVLTPRLSANISFVYPGMETDMKVEYRNLTGFTVELYRMNIPVTSHILNGEINSFVVNKYGKLVDSRHYRLAATPDYKKADTVLRYKFPDEGIFILKSIPDGNRKYAAFEKAYVSSLQAITVGLPGKKQEINIIDKLTGHPVAGAEVAYYRVESGGGYRLIESHATDSQGRVTLTPPNEENWLGMNIRKPGADYMEINYVGYGRGAGKVATGKDWKKRVSLFTDRALYNPGQVINVSGVVYEQSGDSTRVIPDAQHKVVLLNANRQEIGKIDLTSDEFGTFSGNFVLSETTLPGEFELSVKDLASRYIRVDEYKQPTFDVIFRPYQSTCNMGDSLLVEGDAKTFGGAPAGACKLTYKIVRMQNDFWKIANNETLLAVGELQTETDGSFKIPVFLRKPDNFGSEMPGSYYTYRITADVTNLSGETQSGILSLPVGKQSLALDIRGLRSKVAREKRESIQIQAVNLNHQPVEVQAVYTVYPLDNEGRKGKEVCHRTIETQQSFIPDDLLKLPAGRYRIEVSATDEQGRLCLAEQDFVLFSLSDRRLTVHSPEWFYQDGTEFDGQHPVDLYVGSSEKDVYLLYDVYSGSKRIKSERIMLSDEIRKFSYSYKPEYGDGITVNFAFMRKGMFYFKQVKIARSQPEKKLQLTWKTFRDQLQPGGKELWELQITHPDKTAANAQLLATLYDASLDKLYVNDWNFTLDFPRYTPDYRASMILFGHSVFMFSDFPYSASVARGFSWHDYSYLSVPHWQSPLVREGFREKRKSMMKRANDRLIPQENTIDEGFESGDGTFVVIVEDRNSIELDDYSPYIPLRENFAETAFFYPSLRTDTNGIVSISFTLPESQTEWTFIGLAHTRNMDYGLVTAKAKIAKPFMVQPNMPRFIRVNDKAAISTTITNISENPVEGTVHMELIDPQTDKVIVQQKHDFSVEAGSTTSVLFDVEGSDKHPLWICRIVAEGDGFSDGEQRYLPVLSNKQWMTEAIPVQLKDKESKTVSLDIVTSDQ